MLGPAQRSLIGILEEAPLRPMHVLLWLLSTGGTFLDGYSIFVLGVAVPMVTSKFHLTSEVVGLLSAALVLGAVLGASLGGRAADRFGRKLPLVADLALVALGGIAAALAPRASVLVASQLLIGVGIGVDFPVGASYVTELMPAAKRSRAMVATIAFQAVGMLAGAGICIAVLLLFDRAGAWRLFFGGGAALAAVVLLCRLWMPESPRWLLGRGRNREAAAVIARLVPTERPHLEQLRAEADRDLGALAAGPAGVRAPGAGVLFRRDYRRRTTLVALPWLLMDVATYGIGLFTPVLLASMAHASLAAHPLTADLSNARGSAMIDLFLLVGFLVGMWAVPRFGRIRMQMVGFLGMAAGMSLLYGTVRLAGGARAHVPLVFAAFILFNLLMNMGPNSTTFALAPELFPTRLRATASGFAAASAKLGATVGVFALPIFKARFGVPAVLLLMAIVSLLGLTVTWTLGRGVRESHSVEERDPAR